MCVSGSSSVVGVMVPMACAVAGVRRHRLLAASSYPMSVSMDTFCCLCAAAWLRGLNGLIERSRRRPGMHGNLVLSSTAVHVHVHCMLVRDVAPKGLLGTYWTKEVMSFIVT